MIKKATENFMRTPITFKIGISLLLVMIILSMLEPTINGYILKGHQPLESGVFEKYLHPSLQHPLGTDHYGRDVLALLIVSLKNSLLIGAIAGGIATLIGIVIATAAGYLGGKIDVLLNGITNTLLVIPSLPILIAIAAYTRLNLFLMSITLAIFRWPWTARLIRAQILSIKERDYIELARISNMNSLEIMFLEILPNTAPFIGIGFANSVIGVIFAETGLRLLGLGPGELSSLGLMINWALKYGAISSRHYALLVAPAGTLTLIFITLNLINIGLEETFNPRLKKITGV